MTIKNTETENSFLELEKELTFLGKIPERIKEMNKDEILDFFLYTFEMSWYMTTFENITDIKVHYLSLIENDKIEITENEKNWSYFILLGLKQISVMNELLFVTDEINNTLYSINSLSLKELEKYVNIYNAAIRFNVDEYLNPRFSMKKEIELDMFDGDLIYYHLSENKDKFISILKQNISLKDINDYSYKKIFKVSKKIQKKYGGEFVSLYDAFIEYLLSSGFFYNVQVEKTIIDETLYNITNLFFKTMLSSNQEKIDKLSRKFNDYLTDL